MTENFYTRRNYNVDHSTFGGIISNYDFDGHTTMADIAQKILSSRRFDMQCKRNAESNERYNKYGK